ncbi:MAG: hypothetical protein M3279_10785 [Actinomycetota bacterium]|nr:hypothetical protein [Actinomycetota bacterium]
MHAKRLVVSLVLALTGLAAAAGPAHAGCSNGTIAVLYRKITGEELIHCP